MIDGVEHDGDNDPKNLATKCQDCNLGKGKKSEMVGTKPTTR
jgi:hypothetical protein